MQSAVVAVAVVVIFVAVVYGGYSLLGRSPLSRWMSPVVLILVLAGFVYWQIRRLRSKATVVTPGKALYVGKVYRRWHILVVLLSIFFIVMITNIFLGRLAEDNLVAYVYFPWIIMWMGLVVRTAMIMVKSTIRVEEDGLILSESLLRTVPPRFIPFEGLDAVRLKRSSLRLVRKGLSVDEWMTVRDPRGLRPIIKMLERDGHLGKGAITR